LYVDGVAVGGAPQAAPLVPNGLPLQIGSALPAYGNRFDGIIDELSVYNRALTDTEIQVIYSGTGKCPTPPLLLSVNPNSGQQGQQNLPVTIVGQNTHFSPLSTQVNFGPGIAVASLSVSSDVNAKAILNIDPTAAIGARDVILTS